MFVLSKTIFCHVHLTYLLRASVRAVQTMSWTRVPCSRPHYFRSPNASISRDLKACMALAAILAASVLLFLTGETNGNPSVKHFWRPALSCTLASPFGCKSLD